MKPYRQTLPLFAFLVLINLPILCPAWITDPNQPCTWGIANANLPIPAGCVPVGAVLTLHHLYTEPTFGEPMISVYLLRNPAEGLVLSGNSSSGDPFVGHGACLGRYIDPGAIEGQDLIIDLSGIEDLLSWVWSVYDRPYILTLGNQDQICYSSALLELLDYSGSERSFGFGVNPQGTVFSGITLYLTVQSMTEESEPKVLIYSYGDIYAPQLAVIPEYSITCEQTLVFSVQASDEDGDSPLLYWAENLPDGASFTDRTFTWTPEKSQEGVWSVPMGVSDGTLTDIQTVTIAVNPLNYPPVLDALEDITITENQFLSLQVSAGDPDQDPLTFSMLSGPGWLTVSADGLLSGTPTGSDTGTTSATIQVEDGRSGADSAVFSITVNAAQTGWIPILYDDFESGFGNWIDGGTNCLRSTRAAYAHQGTSALNLQDDTSTSVATTGNLALSAYHQIRVEFWYLCISMDRNTEDFWLQVSTDGGRTYTTVEEWNLNDEFVNKQFCQDTVILSGHTLTDQTRIRFRCDAGGRDDDVYIDQIAVSAQ